MVDTEETDGLPDEGPGQTAHGRTDRPPETPPAAESQEQKGGFWEKQQKILEFAGGTVALIGGIVGLVFVLWPDAQPEPEPDPSPVELVDSDVDREENVAADVVFDGQVTNRFQDRASVVSATLRNSGDNPVLITHAEVRITALHVVDCGYGAGATDIKARYDIKVPDGATKGSKISRKMKYTLPPHTQERVAFTVGPRRYGEGSVPRVYTFTVALHLDDGSEVVIPEISYLSPLSLAEEFLAHAEQAINPEPGIGAGLMDPSCVSRQARSLEQLVRSASRPSPELREFSKELSGIATAHE
ncbi:hypothetical protein GCM10010420_14690 [Streptomyces glaucosporus]|uniref:DUF4352 domain-containing protein n=1 Tax=Streptomyces glaucosporus TaxID=284044 RepID=A0ABP5V415_9ACTN